MTEQPGQSNAEELSATSATAPVDSRCSGRSSVDVDEIFNVYQRAGFLYEQKLERMRPFMAEIRETWRRTLSAPRDVDVHTVLMAKDRRGLGDVASLGFWRTTSAGVHSQHLVSTGAPLLSRHVLLDGQAQLASRAVQASQNWFRRENRFPARVFGSIVGALGAASASVVSTKLLGVRRSSLNGADLHTVSRATADDAPLIRDIARRSRGEVWTDAEELDARDLELERLDERYRVVGLRRYRRIYLAAGRSGHAIAIAYRGPLGLSFSFLENRCELLCDPALEPAERAPLARALLQAAQEVYEDCALPWVLTVADAPLAGTLCGADITPLQSYERSTWLRSGFDAWSRHVDSFYDKLLRAGRRARGQGEVMT